FVLALGALPATLAAVGAERPRIMPPSARLCGVRDNRRSLVPHSKRHRPAPPPGQTTGPDHCSPHIANRPRGSSERHGRWSSARRRAGASVLCIAVAGLAVTATVGVWPAIAQSSSPHTPLDSVRDLSRLGIGLDGLL